MDPCQNNPMEKGYFNVGLVYEQCRDVWYQAMVAGGDFSIADALGPEATASLLNSPLAGHIPVQGAISGIINALAGRPTEIQQIALKQNVPFETAAGLHIRTRDISAASRWIAAALEAKLAGNADPISVIEDDLAKEIADSGALGDALGMSKYLAAVTLVGGSANFPDRPATSIRAAVEMAAIADAAEQEGQITPAQITVIVSEGATVTIGGVLGDGNIVASGAKSSIKVSSRHGKQAVGSSPNQDPVFWKNPRLYGWILMAVIAALTLYFTIPK